MTRSEFWKSAVMIALSILHPQILRIMDYCAKSMLVSLHQLSSFILTASSISDYECLEQPVYKDSGMLAQVSGNTFFYNLISNTSPLNIIFGVVDYDTQATQWAFTANWSGGCGWYRSNFIADTHSAIYILNLGSRPVLFIDLNITDGSIFGQYSINISNVEIYSIVKNDTSVYFTILQSSSGTSAIWKYEDSQFYIYEIQAALYTIFSLLIDPESGRLMFSGYYLTASGSPSYWFVGYTVYIYTMAEFTNSTLVATIENNSTYPLGSTTFPFSKDDRFLVLLGSIITGTFISQTVVDVDITYTPDTVDNESFISFNLEDLVGSIHFSYSGFLASVVLWYFVDLESDN